MSTDQKSKLSEEVNNAIKMIGDDHILCIIANLADSGLRFNELQRELNGINPTTLSDRLSKLEQMGLVDKIRETLDKLSVLYELTKKGQGIIPIVNEIAKFAKRFPIQEK